MKKIGFVGLPGTGKTSMAQALATKCRKESIKFKNIEVVSEYARRYIRKHGEIQYLWEQVRILRKQQEWEDAVAKITDLVIVDSPIHLGFLYCCEIFKKEDKKDIMLMSDVFKMLIKMNDPVRYNMIFYLPFSKSIRDGIRAERYFDSQWQKETDIFIKIIFKKLFKCEKFIELNTTTIEERTKEAFNNVEILEK